MNGRDVSQCSHEEAVEAFLHAQEPITVEVLRNGGGCSRPQTALNAVSASVPSSHRNSVYIPTTKSPSQTSLKESSTMQTLINDNIEAAQEDVEAEDIDEVNFSVLPGLDYEVNIFRANGN